MRQLRLHSRPKASYPRQPPNLAWREDPRSKSVGREKFQLSVSLRRPPVKEGAKSSTGALLAPLAPLNGLKLRPSNGAGSSFKRRRMTEEPLVHQKKTDERRQKTRNNGNRRSSSPLGAASWSALNGDSRKQQG